MIGKMAAARSLPSAGLLPAWQGAGRKPSFTGEMVDTGLPERFWGRISRGAGLLPACGVGYEGGPGMWPAIVGVSWGVPLSGSAGGSCRLPARSYFTGEMVDTGLLERFWGRI